MLQFEVDDNYLAGARFDPREEVFSWLGEDSMHKVMLSLGRSLDSAYYRVRSVQKSADSMPGDQRALKEGLGLALQCVRPRLPYYDWELEEGLLSAGPLRSVLQYMGSMPGDWPVPTVRWYDSANTPCRSSTVGELREMLRYTGGGLERTIAMARTAHAVYTETRESIIPRETGFNPALPVRVQSMEPAAWMSLALRGKAPQLVPYFRSAHPELDKNGRYCLREKEGSGYCYLARDMKGSAPPSSRKKL